MRESDEAISGQEINHIADQLVDMFLNNTLLLKDKTPPTHRKALIDLHNLYGAFEIEFMDFMYQNFLSMYQINLTSKESMILYLRNKFPQAETELQIVESYLNGEMITDMLKDHYIENIVLENDLIDIVLENF